MSERLTAGRESWRQPVRESVFAGEAGRLALLAGGVLGVLVLGYGGYALINRAPRIVPVIEADTRPIRVKPDNPGGMQIVGAEEQIMGDQAAGQSDVVAPPPEIPAPQVLRAQIQAEKLAAAPPPPPAQPVALSVPPPPPPAPAPSAPAAPPPPVAAKPGPGVQVQLAAMATEAQAHAEWQRLSKLLPAQFQGRTPAVSRFDRDGRTFWRLRTSGFADAAAATGFCGQVKAKGGACAVASF